MKNLVSVVTPLFNYARFLPDLINSVLVQTYTHWELIIINDGSQDNPQNVLNKFNDERIKMIDFKKNRGYSFAKNEGILAAQGEYIALIDADDMLTPDSLSIRVKYLSSAKNLWLFGRAIIQHDNDIKSRHRDSRMSKENLPEIQELLKQPKPTELTPYVHAQTVMVKRDFYRKLGLYEESLRFSSDKDMWKRALIFDHIPIVIREPVAIYRKHKNQMHQSAEKRRNKSLVAKLIKQRMSVFSKNGINSSNARLVPSNW